MTQASRFSQRFNLARTGNPQHGVWIMMIAMLLIPSVDVLAKLLAKELSPVQITFLRVAFQSLFVLAALRSLPTLIHPTALTLRLLMSCLFINAAIISMVWGLTHLPVANAIALFFIEPLLLMLLSSLLLKERSSPVKYLLVLIGLIGAMVVIRPNWQLYGWPSVLPMLAALFYALYLISIRSTRSQLPSSQAQAYISLAGTLLLGAVLLLGLGNSLQLMEWATIQPAHYTLILLLGFFSALTHWLISSAFSLTKASVLAPFRYLEIIGAATLGYLIFNEIPDLLTWLGMSIILLSGLAVLYLERRENRA